MPRPRSIDSAPELARRSKEILSHADYFDVPRASRVRSLPQLLCAAVCEPQKMSSGPRGQLQLCSALDVVAGIRQRHSLSSARAAGAA
jgi:hypothetical protein